MQNYMRNYKYTFGVDPGNIQRFVVFYMFLGMSKRLVKLVERDVTTNLVARLVKLSWNSSRGSLVFGTRGTVS